MNNVLRIVQHHGLEKPALRFFLLLHGFPDGVEAIALCRRSGPGTDNYGYATVPFSDRHYGCYCHRVVGIAANKDTECVVFPTCEAMIKIGRAWFRERRG